MSGLRIMVVDDSLLVVKKMTMMLEGLGHQVVHSARTGQQAVRDYGAHQPDLVTMDITMPDMDGIEATRQIVAAHPAAIIIMATSHGQEQMVIDAVKSGAKGYVLKPITPDKLRETIDKVMAAYAGR